MRIMRKYWALFKIGLLNTVAYRGAMAIWILGGIFNFVAISFVWLSANSSGQIASYSKNSLITYYLLTLLLWRIVGWFPFSWIKQEIKDGAIIGQVLLKPVSMYFRVFAAEISWHVISSLVGLVLFAVLVKIFQQYFVLETDVFRLTLVSLSTVISIFVVYTSSLCIGLSTFWLTETSMIDNLYWGFLTILGGSLLPISFIPVGYQTVVKLLPFRYMFSFPLEIYFGKLTNIETVTGFFIGTFWVVFLTWIYRIMWQKGVKVYSSWGG